MNAQTFLICQAWNERIRVVVGKLQAGLAALQGCVAWNTWTKQNTGNTQTNWPPHNLDIVSTWTPISPPFMHSHTRKEEDMGRGGAEVRLFFMPESFGQLSLIWDLQVTLCPHGCLLSRPGLWSETVGYFPCD